LHAPVVQLYGEHEELVGVPHVPVPLQVAAEVSVEPVQVGARHWVPDAYFWQPPVPSQKPVWPQVDAADIMHVAVGSAPPAGTAEQVPSFPATAHELQVPVQAVPQQMPCWQKPCWHSLAAAQVEPSGLLPQALFTH
jgi:hypothetical protein